VIARERRNSTRKAEWLRQLHEEFYNRQIKESECNKHIKERKLEQERWLKHLRMKYDDSKRRKEKRIVTRFKRRISSKCLQCLLQNESECKDKKRIEKKSMRLWSKWLKYRFVKT